jgi:two-component system chemotaxis sensor kinase CheA
VLVARIAEVTKGQLESVNDTWMIHYQDHLLPVAKFEGVWNVDELIEHKTDALPLLIFADRGYAMGLVIDEIVNIIEYDLEIEIKNKKSGSLGTSIINGETTSIVDCEYYLEKAFPGWFEHQDIDTVSSNRKLKLLFVDDSQFFRNLFMPLLTLTGFDVMTANSGLQGLKLCNYTHDFDIIISDIEMPEMSGFEFASALRKLPAYKETTLIALTSRISDSDRQHGADCGFSLYFAKKDQKLLLNKIQELRKEILIKEGAK